MQARVLVTDNGHILKRTERVEGGEDILFIQGFRDLSIK